MIWLVPISGHFRDCKASLVTSLTHVSGAIASVQTFTFTFTWTHLRCGDGMEGLDQAWFSSLSPESLCVFGLHGVPKLAITLLHFDVVLTFR